jgi:hypothetical protein
MWKFKIIKNQITFQNWSTILEFWKSFATYRWGIIYMMCSKKIIACYKRKHKNVQNKLLVTIWNCYPFYKQNIEFTRNHDTFKNSYLFKNDKQKNMSCTRIT